MEQAGGYQRPGLEDPGCFVRTLVIRQHLVAGLPPKVVVKFAILKDGRPAHFEVETEGTDVRVADAIWDAIQKCSWKAGTDERLRPLSMWVLMPVRFR